MLIKLSGWMTGSWGRGERWGYALSSGFAPRLPLGISAGRTQKKARTLPCEPTKKARNAARALRLPAQAASRAMICDPGSASGRAGWPGALGFHHAAVTECPQERWHAGRFLLQPPKSRGAGPACAANAGETARAQPAALGDRARVRTAQAEQWRTVPLLGKMETPRMKAASARISQNTQKANRTSSRARFAFS